MNKLYCIDHNLFLVFHRLLSQNGMKGCSSKTDVFRFLIRESDIQSIKTTIMKCLYKTKTK